MERKRNSCSLTSNAIRCVSTQNKPVNCSCCCRPKSKYEVCCQQGPPGEPGQQGEHGQQGEPGEPGQVNAATILATRTLGTTVLLSAGGTIPITPGINYNSNSTQFTLNPSPDDTITILNPGDYQADFNVRVTNLTEASVSNGVRIQITDGVAVPTSISFYEALAPFSTMPFKAITGIFSFGVFVAPVTIRLVAETPLRITGLSAGDSVTAFRVQRIK